MDHHGPKLNKSYMKVDPRLTLCTLFSEFENIFLFHFRTIHRKVVETKTNFIMDGQESSTVYQLNTTGDGINSTEMYPELPNMEMYAILVPTIWGIITITGALGNALVIYTLIRHGDKNATNYFVINLAISDFAFVVIVTPLTATMYALPHWIFGSGMCKITMYMIYVSIPYTFFSR